MSHDAESISRRHALLLAGAGFVSATAGCRQSDASATPVSSAPAAPPTTPTAPQPPDGVEQTKEDSRVTTPARMPVAFLPHGGGPWPFAEMGFPKSETEPLAAYLRAVPALAPVAPKALLVISAHWEEAVPTVMTAARPPMLYDYYGFPPETYQVQWPAPGAPELASRVRALLGAAGFETGVNAERGYDHGTFVPLKLSWPNADVPTTQLSLKAGLDPAVHVAMGRALAPLRDEGVFILGSGMSYHNMRGFGDPRAVSHADAFDGWLREIVGLPAVERDQRLSAWSQAPSARAVHPREEHLLPLMVVAGAAGADLGKVTFRGHVFGKAITGVHFG